MLSHGNDTTQEGAITSYKLFWLTGVEQGTGDAFDGVRDPLISIESCHPRQAGQPKPDRCLSTISLLHWVHGAYGQHQRSELYSLHKPKTQSPSTQVGTWNVRTMTPGQSDNLQQVSDAQKLL